MLGRSREHQGIATKPEITGVQSGEQERWIERERDIGKNGRDDDKEAEWGTRKEAGVWNQDYPLMPVIARGRGQPNQIVCHKSFCQLLNTIVIVKIAFQVWRRLRCNSRFVVMYEAL